jgi:hypothetical protein
MLLRVLAWIRKLFASKAPVAQERPRAEMMQPLEDREFL